jgi:hypothetical protein
VAVLSAEPGVTSSNVCSAKTPAARTERGRLCFLSCDNYDLEAASYRPRDAEFLRDCFPADSVFVVQARTWCVSGERYVGWYVAAVSAVPLCLDTWQAVWDSVNERLKLSPACSRDYVDMIGAGAECDALSVWAEWVEALSGGVRTGAMEAMEAALAV